MGQRELTTGLVQGGAIESAVIRRAFQAIDRADFVRRGERGLSYVDSPLPIGFGQTISQPTTVAFMLERLQPKAGEYILDVGAGSGWTTALLASCVGAKGKVIGLELIPELVSFGQTNLDKYALPQATIRQASPALGLPDAAPFDKILVSAAASLLPGELVDQLKVGGRLVIPIGNSIWRVDKLSPTEIADQEYPGFIFVPLRES